MWYNPNIHPYMEHQHHLQVRKSLAQKTNLPLIVTEGYGIIEYFRQVVGHEAQRSAGIASGFACQKRQRLPARWVYADPAKPS